MVFEGAEDAAIDDCDFDQLGGNAIFVNNYNRRIAVRGCLIHESGASGVAFVGDPAPCAIRCSTTARSPTSRHRPNARPADRQLSRPTAWSRIA